jgi:cyclohexanone monooxygenase
LNANTKTATEMTEQERAAELEYRWRGAGGGFRMLRTFADQMSNLETNRLVAEYAKSKIREIVKDTRKAEILTPKDDLPFGGKRLSVDSNYYETFNKPHVDIVDVGADPIVCATETGLRTTRQEIDCDDIVFATGFDALTGALKAIDLRGEGGLTLKEKWEHGPVTYLGLFIAGFPNLFVVAGPGSPSVLSNMVHSIETHVDWIMRLLEHAKENGVQRIGTTQEAEGTCVQRCADEAAKTLYPKAKSWYMGDNIDGKPRLFMPFVAGVPLYRRIIEEVASKNYQGLQLL